MWIEQRTHQGAISRSLGDNLDQPRVGLVSVQGAGQIHDVTGNRMDLLSGRRLGLRV